MNKTFYFEAGEAFLAETFSSRLAAMIGRIRKRTGKQELLYLCIGSDRSTGDSLGPLVGHKLLCARRPPLVIGTLKSPVHAVNLPRVMDTIEHLYEDAVVVAVDASLGQDYHVGGITLGLGPLRPGLGVSKSLDEVGDIHITGIVGNTAVMPTLLLQNTRLSLVMEIADSITAGILNVEKFLLFTDQV